MEATLTTSIAPPSAPITHSVLVKRLKDFRLLAASVILGNRGYLRQIQNDAYCKADTFELCDQYSLGICLSWIATKYGFPVCQSSIEAAGQADLLPLIEYDEIASLYPLNLPDSLQRRDASTEELFRFLDDNFEAQLDLISALYQHTLSNQLYLQPDGRVNIRKDDDGRQSGEFYTPISVVNYCLERVLSPDSTELMKRIKESNVDIEGVDSTHERQFKMLDPACGTGNFLIGTIEWLRQRHFDEARTYHFVCDSVYGRDIDARAVQLCKLLLMLACVPYLRTVMQQHGRSTFEETLQQITSRLAQHITVDNTVLSCAFEFAPQFDLVIGNPPYISFGSRNQQTLSVEWQKFLRSRFPASTEYKIRLYSVFQELSLRLTVPGGCVTLLVPDAFLNGSFYQKLRQLILKESHILSLSELPSTAIPGAVVGNWCVACYRKRTTGSPDAPDAVSVYRVTKQKIDGYSLSAKILVSPDKNRFQLVFNDEDAALLQLINGMPPVSRNLRGHTGIRAKKGQASVVSRSKQSENFKSGITSGARVHPYYVETEGTWLEIAPLKLYAGGFDKNIVERPKIMMRQTADRIIAAVDETGLYHLNNVHSFSPAKEPATLPNLHFLCGVLNSKLFLHLYRIKSREEGRALAQIDIEMVEAMPLPEASREDREQIARASEALTKSGQTVQERTDLLRLIDRTVYALFNLPQQIINHIEKTFP